MGLEGAHLAGVGRAALVVHAQHVENAVDQQVAELLLQRHPAATRLAVGGLDRDHDVAQGRAAVHRAGALEQGEGQHVGRLAGAAVAPGQLGDLRVAGEGDRELRLRAAQGA